MRRAWLLAGCLWAAALGASAQGLDRATATALFNAEYPASEGVDPVWDGDVSECRPGTTDRAFRESVLRRVNLYRAYAGLPLVGLEEAWGGSCQAAALMMSANNATSHTPPSNWKCHTAAGADGALRSNLVLGETGARAVDLAMDDPGASNSDAGHRRWFLHPPLAWVGIGGVPATAEGKAALAVRVVGGPFQDRPARRFVAWPPEGYFPRLLLPRQSRRWSLSVPGADFASAKVTVTEDGKAVSVVPEALKAGAGDATLVWVVGSDQMTPRLADTVWDVVVTGVRTAAGTEEFRYRVTTFTPAPELGVQPLPGGQVRLSWASTTPFFRLQQRALPTEGTDPGWVRLSGFNGASGVTLWLDVPASQGAALYRMVAE